MFTHEVITEVILVQMHYSDLTGDSYIFINIYMCIYRYTHTYIYTQINMHICVCLCKFTHTCKNRSVQ